MKCSDDRVRRVALSRLEPGFRRRLELDTVAVMIEQGCDNIEVIGVFVDDQDSRRFGHSLEQAETETAPIVKGRPYPRQGQLPRGRDRQTRFARITAAFRAIFSQRGAPVCSLAARVPT